MAMLELTHEIGTRSTCSKSHVFSRTIGGSVRSECSHMNSIYILVVADWIGEEEEEEEDSLAYYTNPFTTGIGYLKKFARAINILLKVLKH